MSGRFLVAAVCLVCLAELCPGAASGKLSLALEWQGADGKAGRKAFGAVDLAEAARSGLWVAFKTEKKLSYPGICTGGKFVRAGTPTERMTALELVVTVTSGSGSLTERSVLFSKTRPFGAKTAASENVYHLLVLDDFVDAKNLPASPEKGQAPLAHWAAPFWRTRRLALNYAAQSDARTREYEAAFGVKARYLLPRLVLAAEQWLDIPEEVRAKKKKRSGGLFGGALDEVSDEIAGKKKVVPKKVPVYSIDVLLDRIEATGKYPVGFHAARSAWNDVLEGKVIYEAAGGKRRVLTATIVFSQMRQNISARKSANRVLAVSARTANLLDQCERLWPSVKKDIAAFLKENSDWKVLIPQKPVAFYQGKDPIYAMYAWFKVHPLSGRMIGVLPDSTRGAFSDEMARLEKSLLTKAAKKVGSGALKGYFSQVAGMYVAAAGILDGIGMTLCDPALAALGGKDWETFLARHALEFCGKFLEEHAHLYDSYAAQLGFWQGAMVLTSAFGGKDAARECAERALDGVANKAVSDAKKYMEGRVKKGKQTAGKALDDTLKKHTPKLRKFVNGVRDVKDHYDKGAEWGKKAGETVNRFNNAMKDFKNELEKRGR